MIEFFLSLIFKAKLKTFKKFFEAFAIKSLSHNVTKQLSRPGTPCYVPDMNPEDVEILYKNLSGEFMSMVQITWRLMLHVQQHCPHPHLESHRGAN